MDHLVFFKENQSFKEIMDSIRLSYDRPYTSYFPTQFNQISRVLEKSTDILLFYFAELLSDLDRIRIKNLIIDQPKIKICLLSDESCALDAWKLNVFHFEAYPVSAAKITSTYRKYVSVYGGEAKELIIKQDGGAIKIPFFDINYLQAAGNYTLIFQKNDKSIIQTKQLGSYDYICERDLSFNRIHRSLIVNFANVESINQSEVLFYNTTKGLSLSEALKIKIRKEILGR